MDGALFIRNDKHRILPRAEIVPDMLFHQDWDSQWETIEEAVDTYARKRSAAQLDAVIGEIDALDAEVADDAQLSDILSEDLGCAYYYKEPVRVWLLGLRDRLKALAKEKRTGLP